MEEEAAGQRGEQTELRPAVCAWSQDGHHGRAPRGTLHGDKTVGPDLLVAPGCPVQMLTPLWRTMEAPEWPWSMSPHGLHSRAGKVLRMLAALGLGSMTLIFLLGHVAPLFTWHQTLHEEVPPRPWEALGGESGQQRDSCQLVLVESIPQDLPFAAGSPSAQPLVQAWLQLLDTAQESIHVASYYWSLTGADIGVNDSSSQQGEAILQKLQQLLDRNISLVVATSSLTPAGKSTDLKVLAARGAQVRQVPMKHLTGGILHSKFWVVDGRHVYVGSANMDWRSLTQVKELGAVIYNCSHLGQDLEKTFQTYWVLGAPQAVLPKSWPRNFSSHINYFQPLRDRFDGLPTTAYFSASPPALCPHGRTWDLKAVLAVMWGAQKFIYASVMEYFPTTRFTHPARPLTPFPQVLACAGQRTSGSSLQQGCARASAGQLLAQHRSHYVPLLEVSAGPQQPLSWHLSGCESFHRACGKSLEHPLQPGEPQQIHGYRQGGLHRHLQLVRGLLQQHLRRGPGGQPEGPPCPVTQDPCAGTATATLPA
ncbi:5'-3' exonuclease PLD4 isoform X5 [Castor canadensis]|uniref:5'-3' exonuclease PLD4 isoform X5 n=1 Tax=Castor canadensis TaxID=51338 RepID=A0AC58M180_CASCN